MDKINNIEIRNNGVVHEPETKQKVYPGLSRMESTHRELESALEATHYELETVKSELVSVADVKENLGCQLSELSLEYSTLQEKYNLLSQLLAVQPQANPGLIRFRSLLHEDFIRFANQESSLAEEADALLTLQSVEKELALIASFAGVHGKNIIAIAGGFSSGKSEFVNSFIRDPGFRLAVGLNPVTAIPAYVSGAAETRVQAYSRRGGAICLGLEEFQALTHEFVRSFEFDLKTVMPYVSVGTHLGEKGLQHVCFIDTPGYDPAKTEGFTDDDRVTALDYAAQANVVFWVVGLDVNGTLPDSDLDFIRELAAVSNAKFYIVANKADLRSDEDIEDILDEIEDVLEFEDMPFVGISAYSSVRREEVTFRRKSLSEYLSEQNEEAEVKWRLTAQVKQVFEKYRKAIRSEIDRSQRISSSLRSMHLDLLQEGHPELFESMQEGFDELHREFLVDEKERALEFANSLEKKMGEAIQKVFQSLEDGE